MPNFRIKFIFSLVVLLFLLPSCSVTKLVWNKKYDETFRIFSISYNDDIVFLGKNYDYVIDDNSDAIREILNSPSRQFLFINTEKTHLKVGLQNQLSGHITVEAFFTKLPPQNYEFLRALGFRQSEESNSLVLKLDISGKRYLPGKYAGRFFPLDRTYIIPVYYSSDAKETAIKVALTPFAVVADGVILVKNVLLRPFKGN